MITLDRRFKASIERYIKFAELQRERVIEGDHHYQTFNKMLATSLGLVNIKKDNMFNLELVPIIEILQELVIKEIDNHIINNTHYKEAYQQIKQSVQEKANAIKSDG